MKRYHILHKTTLCSKFYSGCLYNETEFQNNFLNSQKRNKGRTFRRSSFFTALILSLETAPSGQFSLDPLLKYFSVPRLHINPKWEESFHFISNRDLNCISQSINNSDYYLFHTQNYRMQMAFVHANHRNFAGAAIIIEQTTAKFQKLTYLALRIICSGRGPNALSIIAKCSKFSCVWNNASPWHKISID